MGIVMGPMESAIEAVRYLLADCPVFREIVGDEPLSRIHWRSLGADPAGADEEYPFEQLAEIRPCATLAHGTFSQQSLADDLWPCHGNIEITVLQNVLEDDLTGDCLVKGVAELRWIRQCDTLLQQIRERVGKSDAAGNPFLAGHTIRIVAEPGATTRDEMQKYGAFYGVALSIEY